jgi:hypothetical protein
LGNGGLFLFDGQFAYRLLNDLVGQRVYIHASMMRLSLKQRKGLWIQTLPLPASR